MNASKSHFIRAGGLILGLALLLAVPVMGHGRRSEPGQTTQQVATAPRPAQGQPAQPGQPGGGPPRPGSRDWEWWKDAEVQKALGLTEAKVKNIAKIFDDRLRRSQPIWEQLQKELEQLDQLTAEQKISVEMYAIEVRKAEALRTMLSESRLVMLYRMYRELTPEQYKKLQEIRDKMRSSGRGRGTGPRH